MVRKYTDEELLNRVKTLHSYKGIPDDYWIIGVRSQEDAFDTFDDKFYLFQGEKFVLTTTGTTNSGSHGIYNYEKYNPKGVATVKSNEWYYGVWKNGLHKGKMKALVQIKPFIIFRDGNKNKKIEEYGNPVSQIVGINFHANTYDLNSTNIKTTIGEWSVGCQVINDMVKYKQIIILCESQKSVSYCLLTEF
jgi:hypothetical protein